MSSPDQDPREAIAQGDDEVIDVRRGMFGAAGTGDTSGYGRLVRTVTLPGSSPRPYGSYFDDVVDTLTESLQSNGIEFHQAIEKVVVYRDELTLHVDRAALPHVAQHLRDDPRLRFEMCLGVSGVHYPHETVANCTPSIRCNPSRTTAASAWKWLCPTRIRTSRRCTGSIRPPTGTSARPTTSSASSSTGTRR